MALKKNFDLKNQLEQLEELHESGIQQKAIDIGEKYSQQLKAADKTSAIE